MLAKTKINTLVEQNRDFIEALKEFDRTGKLIKVAYKERVNFTIDAELMHKFRVYCEQNNLKMSSVIEELIREELGFLK